MKQSTLKRLICSVGAAGLIACTLAGCDSQIPQHAPSVDASEAGSQTIPEAPTEMAVLDSAEIPDLRNGERPSLDQLQAASREYAIWTNPVENVTLNGLGQILAANDVHVNALTDSITGKTKYYTASYLTFTPTGNHYNVSKQSQLYNAKGELLQDWTEINYQSALGDWIIAGEYAEYSQMMESDKTPKSDLYNPMTGKTIENVHFAEAIDDTHFLTHGTTGSLGAICDMEGNVIYNFAAHADDYYTDSNTYVHQGYVLLAECVPNGGIIHFFDTDAKELGQIRNTVDTYLYTDSILEPYVCCDYTIYDPSKGTGGELPAVFSQAECYYYDGEIALSGYSQGDAYYYYMIDAKTGSALTESYQILYPELQNSVGALTRPADYFISMKDNEIIKLNRSGEVVASATVENLCSINIFTNGIVGQTDDYESNCLLDTDLNMIVPTGTYNSISQVYENSQASNSNLWTGQYIFNDSFTRENLLRSDGTILVKDASIIGQSYGGVIAIKRGQSAGLVDSDGNWILKLPMDAFMNSD